MHLNGTTVAGDDDDDADDADANYVDRGCVVGVQ